MLHIKLIKKNEINFFSIVALTLIGPYQGQSRRGVWGGEGQATNGNTNAGLGIQKQSPGGVSGAMPLEALEFKAFGGIILSLQQINRTG